MPVAAKYVTIADDLASRLRQLSQPEEKLPSEAALAAQYACSRQTIRAALDLLVQRGLIDKRRGSGSFPAGSARSRQVVLLAADQSEYLCPALIRQARDVLSRGGLSLTCCDTGGSVLRERALLEQLLADPPAGLLLEPIDNLRPNPNLPLLESLQQAGVHVVYLFCAYPAPHAVCVGEDNFAGGYRLAQHLAGRGYRRIGGLFRYDDSRGTERYRGCMQACLDLGLPFQPQDYLWFSGGELRELLGGSQALPRRFLSRCGGERQAAVCYNDQVARALAAAAAAGGVRVPEQLAMVSFDDSYYAAGRPGITSLGSGAAEAGAAAAETMLALLRGQTRQPPLLPWHLSVRESG